MKKTVSMKGVLLKSTLLAGAFAASTFAARAEDVTIGVLVPLTGELGEFGKIVAGAVELGVAEVNAAGGTKCGNLRTVVADTGGNPEVGIREATKMIESEGAVATGGPTPA